MCRSRGPGGIKSWRRRMPSPPGEGAAERQVRDGAGLGVSRGSSSGLRPPCSHFAGEGMLSAGIFRSAPRRLGSVDQADRPAVGGLELVLGVDARACDRCTAARSAGVTGRSDGVVAARRRSCR